MKRYVALAALVILTASPWQMATPRATAQDEVDQEDVVVEQTSDIEPVSVIASGLESPRRFFAGEDGVLLVASAGRGGERVGERAAVADAPISGGRTANVLRLQDGCIEVIAPRLPSAVGSTGRTWGAADVSVSDGQLYVLIAGGGAAHGNPNVANGVYRIGAEGRIELVADLSAWLRANPVAVPKPLDFDPDGLPTAMTVVGDELWVVEANGGQILRISEDGAISRVVDLSPARLVLTDIIPSPSGGAFVATMGVGAPLDRTAKVMEISPDGLITDVWVNLTAVVGLAFDPDGVLYALESASGNAPAPPFLTSGTGRLLRQTGFDTREVVLRRLDRPISMSGGLDGLLYIAVPGDAIGQSAILRVDPTAASDLIAPDIPVEPPACQVNDG